ncbi:MAG TPA: diacylglycerol kinase family protein [Candidatus Paceibacterota bacterium]|nr:diacylglycerol kinase family protein [Candidatus Paceibacterota bacterium]
MERRYALVVNPKAGTRNIEEKKEKLRPAMEIFNVNELYGLDTKSPEEFRSCVSDLAKSGKVDVLGLCGGDGTSNEGINSDIGDSNVAFAFLPLGAGNAMPHSVGYSALSIKRSAERIAKGSVHELDLVLCDNNLKAMFASVGIDSYILSKRDELQREGHNGFVAYAKATWDIYRNGYERLDTIVRVDNEKFVVPDNLLIIVTKFPCYGYGLNVVPKADMTDGNLHLNCVSDRGIVNTAYGIATGFRYRINPKFGGCRVGEYKSGKRVTITTPKEVLLETDGTVIREGCEFEFEVIPRGLRLVY